MIEARRPQMEPLSPSELVQRIHNAPPRVVLAVTGGGSGAISQLLEVPGASRTVLEAIVPYANASLEQWLKARPEHYCSARTARAMACAGLWRAQQLTADEPDGTPLAGIGATCSLASDRPKRGDHRIHVAWQSMHVTNTVTVTLSKGARDRAGEEEIATRMVLNATAAACGLTERVELPLLPDEDVQLVETLAPQAWCELLAGRAPLVCQQGGKLTMPAAPQSGRRTIFPGAFHPLHDGHRELARVAEAELSRPVEFEISVANPDKPPLDFTELEERCGQFEHQTLWLTRAPTFLEKARLFPGATFLVGADTITRISEPRYYHDDPDQRDAALDGLAEYGCSFLVFGRKCDGSFATLDDLSLPPQLMALSRGIPESRFRADISSTEIRRREESAP